MTFQELQDEILLLVIDTPTAVQTLVPKFVNRAIKKLQRKHNFKIMETSVAMTTGLLIRTLDAVPDNWKQVRSKPYYTEELGSVREMKYVSTQVEALVSYGNDPDLDYGSPRLIFENSESGKFEVYPFPDGLSDYTDGEYRVTLPYWKFLDDLSASSDTNWFTENAEQWIIYQGVAEAFYANEDEDRAQVWERRAAQEYKDVLLTDKTRRQADTETFVYHTGARSPHTQE